MSGERVFKAGRLPLEVSAWVCRAIGPGSRLTRARGLTGGTSAALHALDVEDARGVTHRVVLKRFVLKDWLAEEPDLAEREARVLSLLETSGLPTPRLVAVDPDAGDCDVPSLLMTRLPGRIDVTPRNEASWLQQMAVCLPLIHDTALPPGFTLQPYAPYYDLSSRQPPEWTHRPDAWRRAFDLLNQPVPSSPPRFIHRDYHPLNLLWRRGRLSGVLDWTNASLGPVEIDVGHCRANLARWYGLDAADRFLAAWQSLTGLSYDPYWDLHTAADFSLGPIEVAMWQRIGLRDLTPELVAQRCDDYIEAALQRL